jgi:hypothetical protein
MNQPIQAASLKDLNQCADYAKPAVEHLFQSGIVSGYADGFFYPQKTITRAQMVTLIVKSLELNKNAAPEAADTFKDVPASHWANKYVEIAFQSGITSGVAPDQFGPDLTCTREQMITLFVNTLKILDEDFTEIPAQAIDLNRFSDSAQISQWARDPVAFSVYMGLISGTSAATIGPKTSAERQQVAVLTDRFMTKKDNIVNDLKAQRILGKAVTEQFNSEGISNLGEAEVKVTMEREALGLPAEFTFKAHLTNAMVWPDTFHQAVSTEITGLPDNYQFDAEQYLVDGVLYQKTPDENNQTSWTQSSANAAEISNLIKTLKDSQSARMLLPEEIHKSAAVTFEDAVVNGNDGYKITYQGQLTDLASVLDRIMPASVPETMDNSEYQYLQDIIKESVQSFTFTEVFYVGEDNLIYGTDLNLDIDCRNVSVLPLKTINITVNTTNYKYQDISITLPSEARNTLQK